MKTKTYWRKTIDKVRRNLQTKHTRRNKIYSKNICPYRDEMIDSFSSSCLEKVVEYLISKEYVITNYFDMAEMEEN